MTAYGTYGGAPLLPIEPFRDWLEGVVRRHTDPADILGAKGAKLVAKRLGCHPRRIHFWLNDNVTVTEEIVERAGIVLSNNPRLAAELYPRLAEPVCQMCGAQRGCEHLTK